MRLPLSMRWRLYADTPPAQDAAPHALAPHALAPHAFARQDAPAFSLPGTDELAGFADLIEDGPSDPERETPRASDARSDAESAAPEGDRFDDGVPFSVPGALPDDASGSAVLAREIDFGRLSGERATLSLGLLAGRGEVFLGGERIGSFHDESISLDVTHALTRARTQTLELRFDASRPAGVFGPAMLRVSRFARLSQVDILPDAPGRTMSLRARVCAQAGGEYRLRAAFLPTHGGSGAAHELTASLRAGEERVLELTLDAPAEPFVPGKPYDAPLMRAQLFLHTHETGGAGVALCDEAALLCGYGGPAARFFLPLTRKDCASPPDELVARLKALHIPCVGIGPDAPEALLLALTRAGIGARIAAQGEDRARLSRFPCVSFAGSATEESTANADIATARLLAPHMLCGMIAYPREIPSAEGAPAQRLLAQRLLAQRLLAEAAGRPIASDGETLAWLRAVLVRLRAEAMRQGMLTGALCLDGEWREADIADALRTALLPAHLSALPLYGAWWTRSRFSAALHAFLPEDGESCAAEASLETEDGATLAAVRFSCPQGGGRLGLIEAALPDVPCVLTLHTRLLRGEATLEESVLPVYVGARAPLESAF